MQRTSDFFISVSSALLLVTLAASLPVHAQNELVANPDAVKLRRVWTKMGSELSPFNRYGFGVSALPDLTGDSIREFAVYHAGNWLIYKGGNPPDTAELMRIGNDSANLPPYHLLVDDFRGDGVTSIGMITYEWRTIGVAQRLVNKPMLFEVHEGGIAEEPWTKTDYLCYIDMWSGDLDGNGGAELAVLRGCAEREIVFYRGGAGFDLTSPAAVVRDGEEIDQWTVRFGDYDGDGRQDMLTAGLYPGEGPQLRFWWGDEGSPYSCGPSADRIVCLR